jgi:hypothetical protein
MPFDAYLGVDDTLASLQIDAAAHGAVAIEIEGGAVLLAAFDNPFAD